MWVRHPGGRACTATSAAHGAVFAGGAFTRTGAVDHQGFARSATS
jgi:hypothetical protein